MLKDYSIVLYFFCFVMIVSMFPFGYLISSINNAKKRKNALIGAYGGVVGYIIVYIPINYFIKDEANIMNYVWLVIATITMMIFFFLGFKSKKFFQSQKKRNKD